MFFFQHSRDENPKITENLKSRRLKSREQKIPGISKKPGSREIPKNPVDNAIFRSGSR